jgi:hypothetical protein
LFLCQNKNADAQGGKAGGLEGGKGEGGQGWKAKVQRKE